MCAGLSFCIIPMPITIPVGIISAIIALALSFVALMLDILMMLGAKSPRIANFLNGIITPVIDFYHRIEEWAIS